MKDVHTEAAKEVFKTNAPTEAERRAAKARNFGFSYGFSTTSELGVPHIAATASDVTVCGVRIPRPESISPSQWLAYWERR